MMYTQMKPKPSRAMKSGIMLVVLMLLALPFPFAEAAACENLQDWTLRYSWDQNEGAAAYLYESPGGHLQVVYNIHAATDWSFFNIAIFTKAADEWAVAEMNTKAEARGTFGCWQTAGAYPGLEVVFSIDSGGVLTNSQFDSECSWTETTNQHAGGSVSLSTEAQVIGGFIPSGNVEATVTGEYFYEWGGTTGCSEGSSRTIDSQRYLQGAVTIKVGGTGPNTEFHEYTAAPFPGCAEATAVPAGKLEEHDLNVPYAHASTSDLRRGVTVTIVDDSFDSAYFHLCVYREGVTVGHAAAFTSATLYVEDGFDQFIVWVVPAHVDPDTLESGFGSTGEITTVYWY